MIVTTCTIDAQNLVPTFSLNSTEIECSNSTVFNESISVHTMGNDEEMVLSADGLHTPATSLSASQLLRLKRLHDEVSPSNKHSTKSQRLVSSNSSQIQTESQVSF